jgi:hypothetical protein
MKKNKEDKLVDERFNFYKSVRDSTMSKLIEQKNDLITYCLEELEGCEKLYGLMFIFVETDNNDNVDKEDKELIEFCTILMIGDMLKFENELINALVNRVVDLFYSFDKLRDGYLVTHNFVEMEKYLKMRKTAGQEQNN